MKATIVWFESDLRTVDHDALQHAVQRGGPVVPVFLWDGGVGWAEGAASRWWLHHSLAAFKESLGRIGLRLCIRSGPPAERLLAMASEADADLVVWQHRHDPARAGRGREVADALARDGIRSREFGGELLHDPDAIQTGSGTPYKVFTPFYRRFMAEGGPIPSPQGRPEKPSKEAPALESLEVEDLKLLPAFDWASGLRAEWTPGERGALERLAAAQDLTDYVETRNIPSVEGTSRLSPHLHFGEVSPRQAWHATEGREELRRQLVWREFANHLMVHFPETRRAPLREDFEKLPWLEDADALRRWQRGMTGYPIVDAGMRQLWATGWMHNRVRMIVASFLTKDLLQTWLHGQDWFNDTLVDANLANNVLGWQWAAGCGADSQPFFRIFNPVTQGKKFDPDGAYVRKWVPELASVSDKYIHEPWKAGPSPGYPSPMVDHSKARERALEAFAQIKG